MNQLTDHQSIMIPWIGDQAPPFIADTKLVGVSVDGLFSRIAWLPTIREKSLLGRGYCGLAPGRGCHRPAGRVVRYGEGPVGRARSRQVHRLVLLHPGDQRRRGHADHLGRLTRLLRGHGGGRS